MALQHFGKLLLQCLTHEAGSHRLVRVDQHCATSPREARLPAGRFPVEKVEQLVAEDGVAENICQPGQSLLDGANSLHQFCPLLEQFVKLSFGGADYLLDVRVGRSGMPIASVRAW